MIPGFEYLKANAHMVPIATAAIALFGVILSALVSSLVALLVSKRASYLSAVTAERSKWIDTLRGNIAELLGICGAIHATLPEKSGEKAIELRQNADRLIALISLQLNPKDKSGIDRNLLKLLPKLVTSSEVENGNYRKIEERFVKHAQFLLKEEWEKVKIEAQGAILARITGATRRRRQRSKEYREFADLEIGPTSD